MARQVQLRRGTTAENNVFTGAIGELTMDTDTNGLRIHDGVTVGGQDVPTAATADYVVESQLPTADNGYTWYRKYKSGWVEQGGTLVIGSYSSTQAQTHEIILPMAMQLGYAVSAMAAAGDENAASRINFACKEANATNIVLGSRNVTSGAASGVEAHWQVSGMAAS